MCIFTVDFKFKKWFNILFKIPSFLAHLLPCTNSVLLRVHCSPNYLTITINRFKYSTDDTWFYFNDYTCNSFLSSLQLFFHTSLFLFLCMFWFLPLSLTPSLLYPPPAHSWPLCPLPAHDALTADILHSHCWLQPWQLEARSVCINKKLRWLLRHQKWLYHHQFQINHFCLYSLSNLRHKLCAYIICI